MLYYHYIILSVLALIFINFLTNMILFRNIRSFTIPQNILKNHPLISVLVPARNEAGNIYRCIKSLLKQDYPNLEIIVLDDNSIDSTSEIVAKIAAGDPRVRLINGKPLEKGWLGKCWACSQLSGHAKGDYFIFTDADTLHYTDTVSKAFAALVKSGLDAMSVYPKQITVTFHERMTVPFINFAILSFMPLVLIKYLKGPFFSTGIGQFFMFKKDAYQKMGGHFSVRKEVLEDIHLSKQIKRAGLKYMIFDGKDSIYCRMYRSFGEVIKGFTKFIYAAFNYNAFSEAAAMTAFAIIFLVPFILLPIAILFLDLPPMLLILNISQVFIILAIKIILALRFKNRLMDAFFMPFSVCYMLVIAVNSYLQAKFRKGVLWKGRTYNVCISEELELVEDSYQADKS